MEDFMTRVIAGQGFARTVPEDVLCDTEALAASIEKAVQDLTDWGVADLTVEVSPQGVLLRGRCRTYYTKQLAQHAAMGVPGSDNLVNSIEVS